MDLTMDQASLARGLRLTGRIAPSRSPLPILQGVMLDAGPHGLTLTATDGDLGVTTTLPAEVTTPGCLALPARLLSEYVAQLPAHPVRLTLDERRQRVHVTCGATSAHIGAWPADEFPTLPNPADDWAFDLDTKRLQEALSRVAFATAHDTSRPVLSAVLFDFGPHGLTLAAADGFRLAVADITLPQAPAESVEVIIPSRALRELSRLIGDSEEQVEMRINPQRTQVLFAKTDVEMVAQLIQGTFPNYNQLIPADFNTKVTVSVDEFKRETRIAAIFARDGSGIIRLQMAPGEGGRTGQLTISARADEIGDNEGKVDCRVEGDASKIAFNSRYLQDVLNVLNGSVVLEMTSPSSQGVFRPIDENGIADPGYVHVVMPMFVQW